jgi:hypothetical protein
VVADLGVEVQAGLEEAAPGELGEEAVVWEAAGRAEVVVARVVVVWEAEQAVVVLEEVLAAVVVVARREHPVAPALVTGRTLLPTAISTTIADLLSGWVGVPVV